MFDIGFPELLIISIVALLVFGPERLPEVLRTVGGWLGSARRSFTTLKAELEKEVGADEIRRDLHNSRIMEEAKQLQRQVSASRDEVEEMLGKRYAALTEDERRQQSGQPAADDEAAPAAAPAAVPAPDRGSDASRQDDDPGERGAAQEPDADPHKHPEPAPRSSADPRP